MNRFLAMILAMAFTFAASSAVADCSVQSDSQARALVELYTSEGCSSCPPADHWLSDLATRGDKRVVPIAFHVSYWDYIGWKDRFGEIRYGERQRNVAQAQGASMVYTPQVMIGGRDFQRWSSAGAVDRVVDEIAGTAATARIVLASKPADVAGIEGNASMQTTAKPGNVALFVALTQDGLSSKVTAGENRGENLHHNAVVRDFALIASGNGAFHFARKPDWDPAHMSLVAFAQDTSTGRVLQAMSVPACR
jgi:hypothetical protein